MLVDAGADGADEGVVAMAVEGGGGVEERGGDGEPLVRKEGARREGALGEGEVGGVG